MKHYNINDMRTKILLSALAWAAFLPATAQDDLYYTPSKSSEKIESSYEVIDDNTSEYIGSDRDVDEYNRRGRSYYCTIVGEDSAGNDIIEFIPGDGYYPEDSVDGGYYDDDDYEYSRHMSRYDDYYWYDPGYYGYYDYWYYPYWYARWGWYGPWYSYWYDPWYYSWWGWGYYPHYHWHHGYAWGGHWRGYRGHTGTRNVSLARSGRSNYGYGSRVSGYRGSSRSSGTSSSARSTRSYSRGSSYSGSSRGSSTRSSGFSGGSRGGFSGGSRGGGGGHGGGGGRR